MLNERRAVLLLRCFLVLLFAILLVFQVMSLPGQFRYMAEQEPDLAHLRWPFTLGSVGLLLCVQVVVVCTWRLLGLVEQDRIFTEASMVWVDTIVRAVAVGWLLLVGIDVLVATVADDPGGPLLLLLLTTGVSVVGLLLLVMRALLQRATSLRTDLEAVI
jgi:hypothetical protein